VGGKVGEGVGVGNDIGVGVGGGADVVTPAVLKVGAGAAGVHPAKKRLRQMIERDSRLIACLPLPALVPPPMTVICKIITSRSLTKIMNLSEKGNPFINHVLPARFDYLHNIF